MAIYFMCISNQLLLSTILKNCCDQKHPYFLSDFLSLNSEERAFPYHRNVTVVCGTHFSLLPFRHRFSILFPVTAGADVFFKHSGLTASVKGFLKLSLVSKGKKRRIAWFWFMVVDPKLFQKCVLFPGKRI